MHREISHADQPFASESRLPLYLLTPLLGVLLGLDIWPAFATWVRDTMAVPVPSWPREVYGVRWSLIAAVLGGARILYGSIESLLEGRIGADLALALACVAAILFGKPLVAAEVVFIGMLGECLEGITFDRTQRAVRKLVEVFPRRCWLLRDGQEVRVLANELKPGDRVVVKPGARIPADGVVLDGRSSLDTSALTGESLPVDVSVGSEVLAGSLNQFGALTIEARRVAEHTVVGRVIELTARALKDKAAIERMADRLARYFLPVVLVLAALTFLVGLGINMNAADGFKRGWFEAARRAIDPTLAVLVVACPCALILATPAAVIAALGRLAGTGVLLKGGSALERLAVVSAIAFDKTGTLTEGKLELGDVKPVGGASADEVLRVAATAEQRSEHPIARLILQEAAGRKLTLGSVDEFRAQPGAGVIAQAAGEAIVVGTSRLLAEQGISISAEMQTILQELDSSGQTPLLVARNGAVVGIIGARDRIRPEAVGVLAELRQLGIRDLALLTGDRQAVARTIAAQLEITEVHAELLPADKAAFLERWRGEQPKVDPLPKARGLTFGLGAIFEEDSRRRVAMVGDGINDAPALAVADVGLAIGGTGSDIAAEAGDVVFMGDPLRSLPLLVELSRETVRIIRQNILIFAFVVNVIGIVATAWLWPLLTPVDWHSEAPLAAVIYHQFGSLAVLANSMRLLWFGRSKESPTFQKARTAFERADRWMATYLDPGEIGHWISHHGKAVSAASLLLVLGGYALSGLVAVRPDEVAVVRRFGKPLDDDLGPGLHWCWPYPIDEITRVQPERVKSLTIGFQAVPGAATSGTWDTAHQGAFKVVPDEAVMITGDGNLIEVLATVRYTVERPRTYLFEVGNPDEILRATTEGVLREAVAGRPFVELLTAKRGQLQDEVRVRLEQRCAEYGSRGLGLRIDGISLLDLHPPLEVVSSYHEVARSMEKRDTTRNDAERKSLMKVRAAESARERDIHLAEAERSERRALAEAEKAYFLSRLSARRSLSFGEEAALVLAAIDEIGRGRSASDAHAEYRRRRQEQIALNARLVEFRAFWDALGLALNNREKIILDAEKIAGRRQLMLFDPERFRVPVPMLPSKRVPEIHEGP